MRYRTLGQGLQVSALGLGCMPMAGVGTGLVGSPGTELEFAL